MQEWQRHSCAPRPKVAIKTCLRRAAILLPSFCPTLANLKRCLVLADLFIRPRPRTKCKVCQRHLRRGCGSGGCRARLAATLSTAATIASRIWRLASILILPFSDIDFIVCSLMMYPNIHFELGRSANFPIQFKLVGCRLRAIYHSNTQTLGKSN